MAPPLPLLPPPCSAFLYALAAVKPSALYWQAALVYSEALVVAQVGSLLALAGLNVVRLAGSAPPPHETPFPLLLSPTHLQFAYMVPERLACSFLSPQLQLT